MAFCKALDGTFCQGLIRFKAVLVRRVLHDDLLVLTFQHIDGVNA